MHSRNYSVVPLLIGKLHFLDGWIFGAPLAIGQIPISNACRTTTKFRSFYTDEGRKCVAQSKRFEKLSFNIDYYFKTLQDGILKKKLVERFYVIYFICDVSFTLIAQVDATFFLFRKNCVAIRLGSGIRLKSDYNPVPVLVLIYYADDDGNDIYKIST